jgi:hypothetical protein
MSTEHDLKILGDNGFQKPLSLLEYMVIEDMQKNNINYPHCSVEDVKNYWKEKLEKDK